MHDIIADRCEFKVVHRGGIHCAERLRRSLKNRPVVGVHLHNPHALKIKQPCVIRHKALDVDQRHLRVSLFSAFRVSQ
jgi:hypothetical protein